MGLAPAGWSWLDYERNRLALHGRQVVANGFRQYEVLHVDYDYGGRREDLPLLTIAGHPAQYVTTDYSAGVAVYLDERHVVTVWCLTDVLRLSQDDLMRIAESVTLDGVPLSDVTAPAEP